MTVLSLGNDLLVDQNFQGKEHTECSSRHGGVLLSLQCRLGYVMHLELALPDVIDHLRRASPGTRFERADPNVGVPGIFSCPKESRKNNWRHIIISDILCLFHCGAIQFLNFEEK